jgi:ADP-ribose pyrophosphatase
VKLLDKKVVLKTHPFNVEELSLSIRGRVLPHPYYRLDCPDWVNVLPITRDNKAILIRQPRAGNMLNVLETPGGVANQGEKDMTMAAVRELEEETGFTSQRILPLASLNPNPAIMNNMCHFFLALNCELANPRTLFPDADEAIDLEVFNADELEHLVRSGQVNHSLSALCIMLAAKYIKISQ